MEGVQYCNLRKQNKENMEIYAHVVLEEKNNLKPWTILLGHTLNHDL